MEHTAAVQNDKPAQPRGTQNTSCESAEFTPTMSFLKEDEGWDRESETDLPRSATRHQRLPYEKTSSCLPSHCQPPRQLDQGKRGDRTKMLEISTKNRHVARQNRTGNGCCHNEPPVTALKAIQALSRACPQIREKRLAHSLNLLKLAA